MDSAAVLVQQSESASHSIGNSDSKIMESSSSTIEEGISMVESMDPKTAEKVQQYQSQIKVLLHNYQVCVQYKFITRYYKTEFAKLEPELPQSSVR